VKAFSDRHIRLFSWVMVALAVPLALLFLAPAVLGLLVSPLPANVNLYAANRPVTFTFLDAEGNLIGRRGFREGERLTLSQMPAYLPAAFISMEDRRFYNHNGIDPVGFSRAVLLDLEAGHYVAGGSTISQQTAKIVLGTRKRTLHRKLTELVNAARLERSFSKKEILELYLNRIYLGDGAYGVDAAARNYFGVSASNVSLSQAAMLAALTRAPSVFSPRRDLEAARQRSILVLNAMVDAGVITQKQADAAKADPPTLVARRDTNTRGYYLDQANAEARDLVDRQGIDGGDLTVRTALRPDLQEAAQHALTATIGAARKHVSQGAVVVMRPDGAVTALVGGVNYDTSLFNRATQAHRQPGSAFKPFVYLAALQAGISPWDWRDDQPVNIAGYHPSNYKDASYGRLRLTDALARSVNTISVNLAQEVGVANVAAAAHQMGITSPLQDNASLALGTDEVTPIELTGAYAAFANGGHVVQPYLVAEIDDGNTPLYRHPPLSPQPVIADQTRRDMLAMMYNVMTTGTGTAARLAGHEAAGKTGTTQSYRDAWFVGFTTDYDAGVWVGNDDNSPMRNVTGGTLPAAIWKSAMTVAEQGMPATPLDKSQPPADMQLLQLEASATYIDEAAPGDTPYPVNPPPPSAMPTPAMPAGPSPSAQVANAATAVVGSGLAYRRDAAPPPPRLEWQATRPDGSHQTVEPDEVAPRPGAFTAARPYIPSQAEARDDNPPPRPAYVPPRPPAPVRDAEDDSYPRQGFVPVRPYRNPYRDEAPPPPAVRQAEEAPLPPPPPPPRTYRNPYDPRDWGPPARYEGDDPDR
jgi:penicillin-binding protein 1A